MRRAEFEFCILICVFTFGLGISGATAQQTPKLESDQPRRDSRSGSSNEVVPSKASFSPVAQQWFKAEKNEIGVDGKRSIAVLEDDDVLDDDLAAFRLMPDVNRLVLMHGFSKNGLAHLNGLKSIEFLEFDYVAVTDQQLAGIVTLPNLRELKILQAGIGLPNIGDKGLETLSRLPHLEVLELSGVEVTEDGLGHLKKFPELRELRLGSLKLTWDSLSKFPKLDKLRTLQMTCYDPALINDILRTHNSR